MKIKLGLVTCLALIMSACATPKQPQGYNLNQSQASLAEASFAVSRSVADLAESAQAAHPVPDVTPPPSPASYGMGGVTSIDWSGPIEPLLQQIAKAADYRLATMGTAPAIPVLVTINAKNVLLGDVLRDASYQCGRRASVYIFPASRVIELHYAKN